MLPRQTSMIALEHTTDHLILHLPGLLLDCSKPMSFTARQCLINLTYSNNNIVTGLRASLQAPATEAPSTQNGAGPSREPAGQAGGASAVPNGPAAQGPAGLGPRPSGQAGPQGRLLARADTAYSAEWTAEEQTMLDALAAKLTAEK